MKVYERSPLVSGSTVAPVFTLVAAATTQVSVLQIQVSINSATGAGQIGVGVPAANGTGTLTGGVVQALDPSDVAGKTTVATAFGTTAPTAPAVAMRLWNFTTTVGQNVIWNWNQDELLIAPSGQLVLWQFSGNATFVCGVKVAESG